MPRPSALDELMRRLTANDIAIIPGALETVRSNDTNHRYRQSSDFYYLTGYDEPEAIAVIRPAHEEHPYILFVRPRDAEKEVWDGERAGVEGAKEIYGADEAFPIAEFEAKLPELLTGRSNLIYRLGTHPNLDQNVIKHLALLRAMTRKGIVAPLTVTDTATVIHEMRVTKTDDELKLIERAAQISAEAHVAAMKAIKPGMYEYEVEALVEYVFRKNGCDAASYGSIVGGGNNATVLHYVRNDRELKDGDLVLLDAGAEYKSYAGDITRTFPVNGKFTEAQREIYELVLEAQTACVAGVRPGISMDELYNLSVEILTAGMIRLGLLEGDAAKLIEEGAHKKFYMHKLGHFIGMDVHDVGAYYRDGKPRPLEAGIVVTIEPGLYISQEAENVPDKYRGIGVRIEDNVVVTTEGGRVLTGDVPKSVEEIEALMGGAKANAAH
ncbi:MAG: Xaa-Pro aminopeptidase [Pyrinomonadaceae bacterium MAG19_C2-C3]|nr:Xaa-Pro aminopeptidase [Pyrinomonadaceae bacterium MAG19_C2-C3]